MHLNRRTAIEQNYEELTNRAERHDQELTKIFAEVQQNFILPRTATRLGKRIHFSGERRCEWEEANVDR